MKKYKRAHELMIKVIKVIKVIKGSEYLKSIAISHCPKTWPAPYNYYYLWAVVA